jgi:hypothetical protein
MIGSCQPLNPISNHHELLMANLLTQTEVMAQGTPTKDLSCVLPAFDCRTA